MANITDDTPIKPGTTVGVICEEFEGAEFKSANDSPRRIECDLCSTGVPYASNPTVGWYLADDVLNESGKMATRIHRQRPLVPLAAMCEDCAPKRLFFPCEGVAEVRAFFELDADKTMTNFRITDVSPRDDGIPWNPKELSEQITGIPYASHVEMSGGNWLWGPEDMVRFFLSGNTNIDIRELIKWDGSIDPQMLGQARKKYEQFIEKMSQGGYERKQFRDHVRGDDS